MSSSPNAGTGCSSESLDAYVTPRSGSSRCLLRATTLGLASRYVLFMGRTVAGVLFGTVKTGWGGDLEESRTLLSRTCAIDGLSCS